jgi:hypothetical protein
MDKFEIENLNLVSRDEAKERPEKI